MQFELRKRTEDATQQFLTWTYEGEYAFYDNDKHQAKIDDILSLTDSELAFSVYNEENELVGNCEFYDVGDEGEVVYAVGVQMRPDLTGQGQGVSFCKAIIEQGRAILGFNHLEIAVADFNQRARKVYEQLGFEKYEETIWTIRGQDYTFHLMSREFPA